MDIPVLIRPVPGKGFVATAPAFGWSAEGATAEDALQAIRRHAETAAIGARLATVTVPDGPPGPNPLMKWAETWKDDPMLDEFERAIEEYRTAIDNDPNVL